MHEDCNFSESFCYDCPHRYCQHEDEKYQKLINYATYQIEDGLQFMDIDFEYNDEVALRAFVRFRDWLLERGYMGRKPSFKKWIAWQSDGKPAVDWGYHCGKFYFYKISNFCR